MMNAQAVLNPHRMYPARIDSKYAAAPMVTHALAEAVSDELAAQRLDEWFADLTWKSVAPITALSLTFAAAVLACAQFIVLHG